MAREFPALENRRRPGWHPISDPAGSKLGSGGGGAHVSASAWRETGGGSDFGGWLHASKKLLLMAGGQSRRLPAYAAPGKILLPFKALRGVPGQRLDQTLLEVQLPACEQVLRHAPESLRALVSDQLRAFGGGIELTFLSAVPKGSGLGTSSILAATVLGALGELCGLGWGKQALFQNTLALEQLLTTGGGWQDQAGGIHHGIKLIETVPGLEQKPIIRWLSEHLFEKGLQAGTLLLYYRASHGWRKTSSKKSCAGFSRTLARTWTSSTISVAMRYARLTRCRRVTATRSPPRSARVGS